MKKLLLLLFTVISFLTFGQITTLISSTGDGGFENATSTFAANGWTAVGTSARTWRVGTYGGASNGTKGAYWGTATAYGGNANAAVGHFYRDIAIPAGATNVYLDFKLKYPTVDNTFDYFYVFTTTTANTPVNGTVPTTGYTQRFVNTATSYAAFTSMTQIDLSSLAGTTVRLVFTFKCDAAAPNAGPAVDEINLQYGVASTPPSCSTILSPSNAATGIAISSQTLSWNSAATATGYDVYFGTSSTPPLVSSNQAGTTYATGALSSSTTYYWKIVAKNAAGSATGCSTWSFTTVTPPSNDLCSGATSLPCGTSSLAGTTVNSVSETAPLGYSSNYGVWYTFTGDGQISTITSTTTFDHELVIMAGSSCGSFSLVSDVDGSTTTESYSWTTTNGQQYYIYVSHYSTSGTASNTGTFTMSRTCAAPPTPPSNDACSGATSLPCGTSSLAGTTVNAVSETAPNASTSGTMGVWYTFVGDGQQTTITVVQSLDTRLLVLTSSTGSCGGTYTTVANVDYVTSTNETTTFTTTNGTTYYVYIGYYTSGSNTGTFTISRSCAPAPVPPTNDLCSSPTSLPCGTSSLAGTTVNSVSETAPGGGGYASNYGVWYSFTGDGGQTTITSTGNSFDIEMTIVQGTCASNTLVSSQDNAGSTGTETYTFTTTNATTYYVYVAYWSSTGTSSDVGTFTISRSCVAPCTTTTTAGTLSSNKSSTTVNDAVVFTTTGNGGSITKFEWSYNNFSTVAGTTNNPANPYTLILNVQQPTIWFRTTSVNGACPAGITTPISVTLQSAPPYVYGTSSGDYITNVTLNTINNNSTYDTPSGDAYQDFTSLSTTLIKGSSYTIYASSSMTFGSYSGYAAWIDFDNNGIFDVSENIMQKGAGATKSQTFTVPTTAASATVTMRVLSKWSGIPSTDAYLAAGYDWGEIEEYRISIQSALPVELMYFTGYPYGERTNYLVWKTATEHNCSYYNLLHSEDGEKWEIIGTIDGSGNSTIPIEYQLPHNNISPVINYYKLQQFDFDGTYETYGPISINNINYDKQIVKYVNLMGQEIDYEKTKSVGVYIIIYSDGTSKKVYR